MMCGRRRERCDVRETGQGWGLGSALNVLARDVKRLLPVPYN